MSFTLTDQAVKKVQEFYEADKSIQGKFLRVVVEKGGCASYQYGFTFDNKKDGDMEMEMNGLKILVDPNSEPLIKGSVIDYKEDFSGSGFAINNPNATGGCGCGKSFNA